MTIETVRGQILYLGAAKQEGHVAAGTDAFWAHDAIKILGEEGEKTIGPISILATAEPEVQPGATGSFIIARGSKLKVLVGIVKSDKVYNYTRRAAQDSRKGRLLGCAVFIFGILTIPLFFVGLFLIARALPLVRLPKISRMRDAELLALA